MRIFRALCLCMLTTLLVWELPVSADIVTLAWDAPQDPQDPTMPYPIDGYRLFRHGMGQSYGAEIATTTQMTYTDTVLLPDTYFYVVTAFKGLEMSGYSNEVQVVVQGVAPPAGSAFRVTSLSPALPPLLTTNLLPSGDMETTPWKPSTFSNTKAEFTIVSTPVHGGAQALQIRTIGDAHAQALSPTVLPVLAGQRYRLSVWAQTASIQPLSITLAFHWRNSAGQELPWSPRTTSQIGIVPWTLLTQTAQAPSTARTTFLTVRVQGSNGTVVLDDITVEAITP